MRGTVFRRCTICGRRADAGGHNVKCDGRRSTWAFRVDVSNGNGTRVQKRGGRYESRREAERAMRELIRKVEASTYVPEHARTVLAYLTDEWLPTQVPPKTSANRYRNKRHAIDRIADLVGDIPLQKLTAAHLERAYGILLHGDGDGSRTFAASTVVQTHGVIRQALADAVKWGYVERNVAVQAEPPPNAAVRADRRRAMHVWSPSQLADFLEATRDHWLSAMWLLVATTGLRRGEFAGIVDDTLDVGIGTLVVSWQLVPEDDMSQHGRTRPVHKPVTKSAAGSRTVNLDSYTAKALSEWQAERDERFAELETTGRREWDACTAGHGRTQPHRPFLFCWLDGRHLNPDWISHEFKRLREDAGVPPIRLHDVRHTHASLLLASGEHLKVVQERLGWSTASFMLDNYAHLLPGMQAEAAERFARTVLALPEDVGEWTPTES